MKKSLSLLLILCMIVVGQPCGAHAAEWDGDAVRLEDGGIRLTELGFVGRDSYGVELDFGRFMPNIYYLTH